MSLIRTAQRSDLPALTEIYNYYVLNTPITFDTTAYSVESREEWFSHYAETGPYRLFVAELEGKVAGYSTSSPFRPKAAYSTSVEVSVYLSQNTAGKGLGSLLYQSLFDSLKKEDVHRAYAGVALPNPGSVAIHEKFGFRSIGLYQEVGRKFGQYWTVQWFEKEL